MVGALAIGADWPSVALASSLHGCSQGSVASVNVCATFGAPVIEGVFIFELLQDFVRREASLIKQPIDSRLELWEAGSHPID